MKLFRDEHMMGTAMTPPLSSLPSPWNKLATGNTTQTQLERLSLNLRHTHEECWLDYHYNSGDDDNANDERSAPPEQSLRFLLSDSAASIRILPQLADRAVVARPMMPTELLPKQRTTLFISTVLWARISIEELTLAEFATVRLSDTWFGANTRRGELCYASQTRALLNLDNIQYSPFRAITPITIDNQGEDNVRLDRINVPVPHLTLYCDGQRFWTSALRVLRETNLANANLHIDNKPPNQSVQIAPPRRPIRGGVFERAVDLLFA